MFITKEQIKARSGIDIETDTLALANTMIEVWIGRDESDVSDGADLAALAKATMFQAIYIRDNTDVVLEQAGVKQLSQNDSVIEFNTALFAPFMSPWALKACQKLSWMGTRTVNTGRIFSDSSVSFAQRWLTE